MACFVERLKDSRGVIVGMPSELLSAVQAARRLGISVLTLYGWLRQSNAGVFEICGQNVTIVHYQTGPRGQGRIRIECEEIDRLLSIMRVSPKPVAFQKKPAKKRALQHITAKLGRPDD